MYTFHSFTNMLILSGSSMFTHAKHQKHMHVCKNTYILEHIQAHMHILAYTHIYTCTYTQMPYTDLTHTHKHNINTCIHKCTHIHKLFIGMQTCLLLSVATLEPLKILFLLSFLILNQFLRIYKDTISVKISKIAYLCWETQYTLLFNWIFI